MNLTKKTANAILSAYSDRDVDVALQNVLRRQGGLYAALNEDARRDLILTLGDQRRDRNAWNAKNRAIRLAAVNATAAE